MACIRATQNSDDTTRTLIRHPGSFFWKNILGASSAGPGATAASLRSLFDLAHLHGAQVATQTSFFCFGYSTF